MKKVKMPGRRKRKESSPMTGKITRRVEKQPSPKTGLGSEGYIVGDDKGIILG